MSKKAVIIIISILTVIILLLSLVIFGLFVYKTDDVEEEEPEEELVVDNHETCVKAGGTIDKDRCIWERTIYTVDQIIKTENYEKLITKNFQYGNGQQQIGTLEVAGMYSVKSFSVNKDYILLNDVYNKKIVVLDSAGVFIREINLDFEALDVMIDLDNTIYTYWATGAEFDFYKYDLEGNLLGSFKKADFASMYIDNDEAYPFHLVSVKDKMFFRSPLQNSYQITSKINMKPPSKLDKSEGILTERGMRYKLKIRDEEIWVARFEENQFDSEIWGVSIGQDVDTYKVPNILDVNFIGEDFKKNFYLQATVSTDESQNELFTRIYKIDSEGDILFSLDIPNDYYYETDSGKQFQTSPEGDLWQVNAKEKMLYLNKWGKVINE